MNNIIDNFSKILNFAKSYNLPINKKRAIIREYLQSKIIEIIYSKKESRDIIFIGGTSLRLLHNLDRFSEDLDFDLGKNINLKAIGNLMNEVISKLKKENYAVELYKNKKEKKTYYELRFSKLLSQLNITQDKEEKLMIKFDFEKRWKDHNKEIVLFNRYGFLARIVTASLDNILVQKLVAYTKRRQTMTRDIYDLVWLMKNEVKFDKSFALKNRFDQSIMIFAYKKYEREKSKINIYAKRLKPFLINEDNVDKIKFFSELIKSL